MTWWAIAASPPPYSAMGSCETDIPKHAQLMEGDPLLENLDGLLPLEVNAPGLGSVPANLPSAVEDLCAALQREPGVDDISVGRQVWACAPLGTTSLFSLPSHESSCCKEGPASKCAPVHQS